jgi:predicted phage terminase large subunit-like protein
MDLAELAKANPEVRKTYLTQIQAENIRRDFRRFVRDSWPVVEPKAVQWNWHMDVVADHLTYVYIGDIMQLAINLPPRTTKSIEVSIQFPAWVWTNEPEIQFLTACYEADLAKDFAYSERQLIESPWYQERFGDKYYLLPDDKSKQRFSNNKGGYRQVVSSRGKTTGMGGDYQIFDDPHNVQQAEQDTVRQATLAWHDNAWVSRVNDPNHAKRIYVGQRTHENDVFGHVFAKEEDDWVILCLPLEFEPDRKCITYANNGRGKKSKEPIFTDPRKKMGELLVPSRYDETTIKKIKIKMSERSYNAQFQQRPEGKGGNILKRQWWRLWEYDKWHPRYHKAPKPEPSFLEIIQCYDTAFEEGEENDFSVRTTWGLFLHADPVLDKKTKEPVMDAKGKPVMQEDRVCAYLLERWKDKVSFGDLLDNAVKANEYWKPDIVLIEKKASGHSLIQEMRKKEINVRGVPVHVDLVFRAHMSYLPLEKGSVFYPARNWAHDLIEECAKFPEAEHDDQVSSCTIAWAYMRRYMDLQVPDDPDDAKGRDLELFNPPRREKARAAYG